MATLVFRGDARGNSKDWRVPGMGLAGKYFKVF
jgi:hypothetical protein